MSEHIRHQEEDEATGLILKIIADFDPLNPRVDYDEASTMVCDHRNYNLGDEDGHDKARSAIRNSRDYREAWEDWDKEDHLDFSHGPDLYKAIKRCSDIITLPLYLYDHSGITIRCNPFSCPWDSGQVGFAFMAYSTIRESFMCKRVTPSILERAYELIKSEVRVYDMYLTGDVWGYVIETQEGDEVDSCWGFFGSEEVEKEAESVYKHYINQQEKDNALLDKLGIPEIA